ncbi:hypothetical protein J3R83DRAFT_3200 [Lanmaoa asiatica]|nr:hypothetical protein J3R83DRAFT_3200 [Lanmaoa asiatica]
MSLIFSILRITPPTLLRRATLATAAWFFLVWAVTFGLETWWCLNSAKTLPGQTRPECVLPQSIVIFEATTNCLADAMTVIFSLKLLRRVKLPRRQRRMIVSLFLASRFLCAFSLPHSIAQLVDNQIVEVILGNLQAAAFLVVCNLLVVVTYIYRVFLKSLDEELPPLPGTSPEDDDFTVPIPRSMQNLTTVDLDSSQSLAMTASETGNSFFRSTAHSSEC